MPKDRTRQRPPSGGRWYLARDLVNKYGGWPTVWDVSGTEAEVLDALERYLKMCKMSTLVSVM